MGLVRDVFDIVQHYQAKKAVNNLPRWLGATAKNEKYNIPQLQLPKAQAELYQRLSWVTIATSHVANAVAGTSLGVYKKQGEEEKEEINHPFEQLLQRPNPRRSRYEFLQALALWYELTGNAYIWLNAPNENAEPQEIFIIPSHRIEPVPDENMWIRGYMYNPGNGQKIPLEPWEIAHFKRFNPFSPYVGMSAVESFAVTAEGDMKMQKWNTNFFGKNNAKMPGVLTFADAMADTRARG